MPTFSSGSNSISDHYITLNNEGMETFGFWLIKLVMKAEELEKVGHAGDPKQWNSGMTSHIHTKKDMDMPIFLKRQQIVPVIVRQTLNVGQ